MLVIIFTCAITLLIFDNDPPAFPRPLNDFSPDCYQIFPHSLSASGSRINVSVNIGDLIEFPTSAAIRLLRLVVTSGNTISEYTYNNFWDISLTSHKDYTKASFCVLQPIGGHIQATLYCHKRKLSELSHQINDINAYPVGWSRALMIPHLIVDLFDFCYSNNTIHYFSQAPSLLMPMHVGHNDTIPFQIRFITPGSFQTSSPEHTIIYKPTFFISASPKESWRQLSDILLPMWGSLFHIIKTNNNTNNNGKNDGYFRAYLTRNQSWVIPNVQRLVKDTVLTNESKVCIAEGHFIRSPGSIPLSVNSSAVNMTEIVSFCHHLNWIMDIKPEIMPSFKNFFTNKEMKQSTIVIDNTCFEKLNIKKLIEQYSSNLEIVRLPEESSLITEIAEVVSTAQVFIGSHLSSLIYGIFLPKGATMIEIQPEGCECTYYGQSFATMAGARYHPIRITGQCKKNTILLYMNQSELNYQKVTFTEIKKSLDQAFKK
ncbi:hypothetical protein TRFO_09012 [Tritrichomonas foetus]|uniref:Glycosyltransferase family 61 protein n=1 Tax=Tritrichomonas foetus TaxID=1144522 RepID=A0A1J4JKR2_9EUKA|nr:hypothetical protein TRFO_09012 [Tritrichomonas foetus]|eukprot:OHS98163.1 hypothetical protein TRFO_09012 [Tritrichomonas foetus]